jgi:hypothetical protein
LSKLMKCPRTTQPWAADKNNQFNSFLRARVEIKENVVIMDIKRKNRLLKVFYVLITSATF